MLLLYLTLALSGYLSVHGKGQFPVRNGVIGGGTPRSPGPKEATSKATIFATSANNNVTTGTLRMVENSGICETTPGVYQASGYGQIAANESLWFWFFASRKNPETAPVALWFNGGPGSSSMIGLFQEHGPCRITNDSSAVDLNPQSWNNEVNMLYIDSPVGVGFSHGDLSNVGTTQAAAEGVWNFMQIFFKHEKFSRLSNNSLAIWTESYGGHYGPTFSRHFLEQNAAIAQGQLVGITLNLETLGIGNGLTELISQYSQYTVYAKDNPYHQLVSQSVIDQVTSDFAKPGGCRDQITACNNNGTNMTCAEAQVFCNEHVLGPAAGDWDVYYVLANENDTYPPDITNFTNSIAHQIGAEKEWETTNPDVYENFLNAGDWMRNTAPDLEAVVNAGIRIVMLCGDADYIVNFKGMEAMIDQLQTNYSDEYNKQEFQPYLVRGQIAGQYKTAGRFSYIRVYGAGHEVPAYKIGNLETGEVAAQIFLQTMANQSLSSTSNSTRSSLRG